MCGIAGVLEWATNDLQACLPGMLHRMVHRGPDNEGIWKSTHGTIALGHRRLSILDPSPTGNQPMISDSGRYVITFNGEVYNFRQIREALGNAGAVFRGTSDTEVLLKAIEQWGLEKTLTSITGMFAFAVWDDLKEILYLARDPFGEKPLYYWLTASGLLFSSELTAIYGLSPRWRIDEQVLDRYLRTGYCRQPKSIIEGVNQVEPGTYITVNRFGQSTTRYSDLELVARHSQSIQYPNFAEAVAQTHGALRDAVHSRMVSDVPLGAFLSGGIDSSLVVALMQEIHESPIKTFSIGFEEADYDESAYARAVADALGTEHREQIVKPEDILEIIPRLGHIYGEPFADSSQIPTYLVARLAKRHVTVALSGDGGDELFGGYNRHVFAQRLSRSVARVPASMRSVAQAALLAIPPELWDKTFAIAGRIIPNARLTQPGIKIHKLARLIGAPDLAAAYGALITHTEAPRVLARGPVSETATASLPMLPDPAHQFMLRDTGEYLLSDILVKLDRATMANSLEARCPFLDPRVFSVAWRIAVDHKIEGAKGKIILRKLLERYIPPQLFDRPKSGFGIPLGGWLRGPLFDWAFDLIKESRINSEGYLDAHYVARMWNEHQAGRRNHEAALWSILMFQSWLEHHDPVHLENPTRGGRRAREP